MCTALFESQPICVEHPPARVASASSPQAPPFPVDDVARGSHYQSYQPEQLGCNFKFVTLPSVWALTWSSTFASRASFAALIKPSEALFTAPPALSSRCMVSLSGSAFTEYYT